MAKRNPALLWPALGFAVLLCLTAQAQQADNQNDELRWRSTAEGAAAAGTSATAEDNALHAVQAAQPPAGGGEAEPPRGFAPRGDVRQVSAVGNVDYTAALDVKLPCTHGQIWREYDISPYTLRVTDTNRPEQAVIDWILRETGYEAWHTEPLGILSATPRKLRVYHTAEMQALVAGIVDRFTASQAATQAFSLRVVSLSNPSWRVKSRQGLRPVSVQTAGAQAWVMQKEDASALLAELRLRSDYREHSSPQLLVNNGQAAVISTSQAQSYVGDVTLQPQVWPGFTQQTQQFDEGFSFAFTPLLSLDAATIDATVKCDISQLEKLVPVMIDAPTQASPRQRAKIEVPQTSSFHFHERFRWSTAQVLLISMGMVGLPAAKEQTLVPGIPLPFGNTPARADVLVFIECRGAVGQPLQTPATAGREAKNYPGRY